ncbi:hypothetical protein BCR35DRAFT_155110 [Leucosporidium creatinivorum]|uniref:Uncharacterized protein n=1 Tax=Leucosporidium creatinivorum TaxID=106004 RepID=A0A1Y2FZK3_9BASI|nr:hypothetical protein BCR35DRAFT_155110 [Leucosporidium creatinivorum]
MAHLNECAPWHLDKRIIILTDSDDPLGARHERVDLIWREKMEIYHAGISLEGFFLSPSSRNYSPKPRFDAEFFYSDLISIPASSPPTRAKVFASLDEALAALKGELESLQSGFQGARC